MSNRILRIKNNTATEQTYCGSRLAPGEYKDIDPNNVSCLEDDPIVFAAVASGDIIVNKGSDTVDDILDPAKAWKWLIGDTLPYSRNLEGKLAVHSSPKPEPEGVNTYVVWAGSGDDVTAANSSDSIGKGDLLVFNMTYNPNFSGPGSNVVHKDVKFDPRHGRVWIHEAYIKFENGGIPDYLTADIMAPGTPLQQTANLDLVVAADGNVTFAPGGPGTGTHGFAGTPSLLPRTYSKDGDWDYDGTNLTPNLNGTGLYRINQNEMSVHRYINKIPLFGTSSNYFSLTSDETAELPVAQGYFIRINVFNDSNTAWNLSAIMEIYRERTVDP